MLLLAGMGIDTTANGIHVLETTSGTSVPGGWADALWAVALAVIVAAAWQRPEQTSERPSGPHRLAPATARLIAHRPGDGHPQLTTPQQCLVRCRWRASALP
jgi:hypothetical protein